MKYGLYLCRVKGLVHFNYAILKYDEDGWWQYYKDTAYNIEGWVGNDLEIIEVKQLIEEL